MSDHGYAAIARSADAEIEARRSRFLAHAERVEDEDAARAVIATARRDHLDARHHCSAYVLGPDRALQRSSDDGEPAGTAGAPILAAIDQVRVSDVVVVVTRWFGGTLLGTGGLVRAYGDAARAALAVAGRIGRTRAVRVEVVVGHHQAGRVETELRAAGRQVVDARYDASGVVLTLLVGAARVDTLTAEIAALTGGTARVTAGESTWIDG
ncbi:IMPACT family protein [Microlunatus ginsengisoli]|uniref:YigZ family protein n=1 Tax=Microlunatus ginsengisoli TaxID=363863 RepID=A0ABP6ZL02_9ACTN